MRICLKWLIKYYIELGKEIGIVLSKGKWIEIAYLAITTGIGFLVDTKEYIELYTNINLGQIPVPVLNGLLAGTTILVSLFLYTPMRIFRTNREKIALLEEQQKPKLQIGFDLKNFQAVLTTQAMLMKIHRQVKLYVLDFHKNGEYLFIIHLPQRQ